jgi:hypothetical protein
MFSCSRSGIKPKDLRLHYSDEQEGVWGLDNHWIDGVLQHEQHLRFSKHFQAALST